MATAYDWTTLEEDEEVMWEGEPHVHSLLPAFIVGAVLSIILIGLAIIAWAWVDRENTTYLITNKAVYKKRGAISRQVKRVSVEKIQNTNLSQGVFGTYFDYGTVEISTAGSEGAEMRFRGVPDPRAVQEQLNRQLRDIRAGESPVELDTLETDELLGELLTEIRLIREAVVDGEGAAIEQSANAAEREDR